MDVNGLIGRLYRDYVGSRVCAVPLRRMAGKVTGTFDLSPYHTALHDVLDGLVAVENGVKRRN